MKMKNLIRIVSRYMLSAAGVALTLLFVNFIILFAWLIHSATVSPTDFRVSQVAEGLSKQADGDYVLSDESREMINVQYQWAMFLDEGGNVVWSENLPDDVPLQYSIADVASFSRWYLNDYPVYVWQYMDGLFVVGSEKDSVWKHAVESPQILMDHMFPWMFVVLVLNALLAMLIAMVFGLRLFRSLKPLAEGIQTMTRKKAVHLSTRGLLGEFAAGINKASADLERQEIALSKRDNARSTWIAGVSHDIRTPLSIVMGYASELERDADLPQGKRNQAGIIRKQSERIKTLVNDLNLTSKLEYDMQPLREEVVSLAELVRSVGAEFLNSIQHIGYTIEIQIDETAKDSEVIGDEELLRRAISNLLANSISHNPDGCAIKIVLEESDGQCAIHVLDDGVGFSDDLCKALNQNKQQSEIQSRGLGLKLVRQIVKVHGGFSEFRNLSAGGCEVILWMPCPQNAG